MYIIILLVLLNKSCKMNEQLLQYIWQNKLFEVTNIKTSNNKSVEIINVGIQNFDSGPDFSNAIIKIDNIKWAGNVEIHIRASNWYLHKHDSDPAYNNTILHVVLINDSIAKNNIGVEIPTIELTINPKLINNYKLLEESKCSIACSKNIHNIDLSIKQMWLESLFIERLERKFNIISTMLTDTQSDFDEVFYQLLAKNFGFRTNSQPFEQLSRSVTLRQIRTIGDNIKQIEALLFGQAGFLKNPITKYQEELLFHYNHLKNKFNLTPLDYSIWKFSKMRPFNFPTLRISQFAQTLNKTTNFTNKLSKVSELNQLYEIFNCTASDFWNNHYTFGKESKTTIKKLGKNAINNIIINTVVPFMFTLSKHYSNDKLLDTILEFMRTINSEKNNITRKWTDIGETINSAYESQSYIELYNNYCTKNKCLDCRLGGYILKEL